jgi:hypothetical protein
LTEVLNYEEIYKCFGFKYHATISEWVKNDKGKTCSYKNSCFAFLRPISSFENFISSLDAVMNIGEDDEGIDNQYVNPKLKHQGTFENAFEDKYSFAFGFRAYQLENSKFHKEIRFFYREDANSDWVMAFSAPVTKRSYCRVQLFILSETHQMN